MKNFTPYLFLFCSAFLAAQTIDLENTVPDNWTSANGALSISNAHAKVGEQSLRWDYTPGDILTINAPNYNAALIQNYEFGTTEFNIYSESNTGHKISLEFLDASGIKNYNFDITIGYQGWRSHLRNYIVDMYKSATNSTDISKINITAPNSSGTIFFDDIKVVRETGVRYQTPFMPDITGYNGSDFIYKNYLLTPDIPASQPTTEELAAIEYIKEKTFDAVKSGGPSAKDLADANAYYDALNITETNGYLKGIPVNFSGVSTHIYALARNWYHSGVVESLEKAKKMWLLVQDQGHGFGGTNLYLGSNSYGQRRAHAALVLMFDEFNDAQKSRFIKDYYWQNLTYEFWIPEASYRTLMSVNVDNFHTRLLYTLALISRNPNKAEANQYLKGLTRYLNRYNDYWPGVSDYLKIDGTGYHHLTHNNSYMYAYNTMAQSVNIMSEGPYKIDEAPYTKLKEAIQALFIMSNNLDYAQSLCGRGPNVVSLIARAGALIDIAGANKYNGNTIDEESVRIFNREFKGKISIPSFQPYGEAEFREGFFQFNNGPMAVYRKNGWMITTRGMNNAYWGAEIYDNSNHYGKNQSNGTAEIIYAGGAIESGFGKIGPGRIGRRMYGYDWNHPNGTTTRKLSFQDLKSSRTDIRSDRAFSAALRFEPKANGFKGNEGAYGMFAQSFKEQSLGFPYDPTFTFNKSYHFFDDIIISMGSDINSEDTSHPVVTTLAQELMTNSSDAVVVNGNSQTMFPLDSNENAAGFTALTTKNTGFYVMNGDNIKIEKRTVDSPSHPGDGAIYSGDSMFIYINHGVAPTNASYTYAILPAATNASISDFKTQMETPGGEPFKVLVNNSNMHALEHTATGIKSYAIFTPNKPEQNTFLKSASAPTMLMAKPVGSDYQISSVNPNIQIVRGSLTLPPAVITQITIDGKWDLSTDNSVVSKLGSTDTETIFSITHQNGKAVDFTLIPAENPDTNLFAKKNYTFKGIREANPAYLIVKQDLLFKNNTEFTIEMWVKGDAATSGVLYGEGWSGSCCKQQFSLLANGGKLQLAIATSVSIANKFTNTDVFDNQWHHIAFVNSSSSSAVYIDGVKDSSDFSYTRPSDVKIKDLSTARIGTNGGSNPTFPGLVYTGLIDDVALWSRAVPVNEIISRASSCEVLDGSEANLKNLYTFNEGSGIQTIDLANNIQSDFSRNDIWSEIDVKANASALTICFGEELTLTGSGDSVSYSWDNNVVDGVPFTPTVGANIYTVTGNGIKGGCEISDKILVMVSPELDSQITNNSDVLEVANDTEATYQWIDCDNANTPIAGETDNTFSVAATGSYAVIITKNSCSVTSACFNITTLSVNDFENPKHFFTIQSNPVDKLINILGKGKFNAALYSISGKFIKESTVNKIDVEGLANGVYLLKINANNTEEFHRIIVKH